MSSFLEYQKQIHLKHSEYRASQDAKTSSDQIQNQRQKHDIYKKENWIKNMLRIIQEVQRFCLHLLQASTALTDKCVIAIFHRFAVNHRILGPAHFQRDLLPIFKRQLRNGQITWEVWFKTSFKIHVRSDSYFNLEEYLIEYTIKVHRLATLSRSLKHSWV